MFQLNFPKYSFKVKSTENKRLIFDSCRRKYVPLTPEEWVRQHTIAWLIDYKCIPQLRISQEYPVNINGQHQRADIVVVDNFAKPYILVECKAPNIEIDNEVVMQATRYNAVVKARYLSS